MDKSSSKTTHDAGQTEWLEDVEFKIEETEASLDKGCGLDRH